MLHRAPIGFALPWRSFLLGVMCARLLGKAISRKEGRYWALSSRDWEHMGWRRDHFRGLGELECEAQLCVTIGERLQPVTCLAALFPKVCHVGELVLGKGMGGGGTRELEGAW